MDTACGSDFCKKYFNTFLPTCRALCVTEAFYMSQSELSSLSGNNMVDQRASRRVKKCKLLSSFRILKFGANNDDI